jgi:hypothetical protein
MKADASPAQSAPKGALALGAFALFFLSFLMSGNGNALPQLFFQRNYPAEKTQLLSVALLTATIAGVFGVLTSRRVRSHRGAIVVFLLGTAALMEIGLSLKGAAVFIVCLASIQFCDNFLLNQIDHAAAARAHNLRGFNDAAGIAARLFGMLSAPAFFTLAAGNAFLERATVAVLGCVSAAGVFRLFAFRPGPEVAENAARPEEPLSPDLGDWFVFGYAVTIYLALYLFAANMIYLLRDLFHVPGAETRGGAAIVGTFFAALAANAAVAALRRGRERPPGKLGAGMLAAPALLLIVAASAILAGLRTPYWPVLGAAMSIGAAYGGFLWELRDYSSRAARQGKTALLTWFNNMANISSLFAFGLMFALASARAHSPDSYFIRLMWAIGLAPTSGLVLLAFAAARRSAGASKKATQAA